MSIVDMVAKMTAASNGGPAWTAPDVASIRERLWGLDLHDKFHAGEIVTLRPEAAYCLKQALPEPIGVPLLVVGENNSNARVVVFDSDGDIRTYELPPYFLRKFDVERDQKLAEEAVANNVSKLAANAPPLRTAVAYRVTDDILGMLKLMATSPTMGGASAQIEAALEHVSALHERLVALALTPEPENGSTVKPS